MKHGVRFTHKEVEGYLNEKGYKLLDNEYHNNLQNLSLQDDEGYYYYANLINIRSGRNPKFVGKNNPYSIINIQKFINYHYPSGVKVMDELYKESDSKLTLVDMEGYKYYCTWEYIQTKGSLSKYGRNNPFTVDNYNNYFKINNMDYKVVDSNISNNTKDKATIVDKDGYMYDVSASVIPSSNNFNPLKFSKSNKYTIFNIKKYIKDENINCEYYGGKYYDSTSVLSWICLECGKVFKNTFIEILRKDVVRCKECSLSMSSYEQRAVSVLNHNKVIYKTQYSIDKCVSIRGNKLKFDFAILTNQGTLVSLIEVDGEQHMRDIGFTGKYIMSSFGDVVYNDSVKNSFCCDNKIPLVRVTFDKTTDLEVIIQQHIDELKVNYIECFDDKIEDIIVFNKVKLDTNITKVIDLKYKEFKSMSCISEETGFSEHVIFNILHGKGKYKKYNQYIQSIDVNNSYVIPKTLKYDELDIIDVLERFYVKKQTAPQIHDVYKSISVNIIYKLVRFESKMMYLPQVKEYIIKLKLQCPERLNKTSIERINSMYAIV